MPNQNYNNGRKKEYKLVHKYRNLGKLAFRSAGSHSPFDVVVIDKANKEIFLIQSKPESMSANAKEKLIAILREYVGIYNVRVLVE